MAEKAGFDVFQRQRLAQQGIGIEIDLPDGEVVRRAPIGIHFAQFFGRKRFDGNGRIDRTCGGD